MKLWTFGTRPRGADRATRLRGVPDWEQAEPRWIAGALRRARALPSGGWYVIDATRTIASRPVCYRVAGKRLVVWRTERGLRVAPDACPHMGASLSRGHVEDRGEGCALVCPWHGLALGDEPHGGWRPLPSHDDAVLLWVRLDDDAPTDHPYLPKRPERSVDAVIRVEARCEPEDVVANRLDPWHGAHFHPYAFGRLAVIDQSEDDITVRVLYRVLGSPSGWRRGLRAAIGVEVDARFHSVDPRTIAMTIVDGEGAGSVVETHATPIAPGRTAIVEATLATSERSGFRAARALAPLLRPLIRRAAHRLWIDDAAYAERRYALRRGESAP